MDDQEYVDQTEEDDVTYQDYFNCPDDEPPGQQSLWEITETPPPQH